ncbi:hypothetical protein T4D_2655 [Trichinella pseudospiralis]|uniref:Uncharacterized protein n=1 Tax=Trichinella pseudospiralis TaxID=6337 RepID=A0A0V1F5H0_TRIPS|nr:hypothetical protein T4D_2655 [Trichinella pseudospiralis]
MNRQQRITALTAEYDGDTRTIEQFLRAVDEAQLSDGHWGQRFRSLLLSIIIIGFAYKYLVYRHMSGLVY